MKHTTTILPSLKRRLIESFSGYTHIYTFALLLVYLVIFQPSFVFSGDSWAETFYEYVHGAMMSGWQNFFVPGIAGYFNFLPKLFSHTYILLGGPMDFADYFFRFVTIVFTLGCVSFIAHPFNRELIKNDALRVMLAFAVLLTYYHISSFSFINVWYVGFIPIILVSLNANKFKYQWQEIAYATFAMSVCLTKPSLILVPLIIYRMIRLREFLLGYIILFSATLQTLLFFTSSYYEFWSQNQFPHVGKTEKITSTLLYPGLLLLKLYHLQPVAFSVVAAATAFIGALFVFLIKIRGFIQTALIGLTLCLVSYTAIYPPDTAPFSVRASFQMLFSDQMKLQREVLISFLVLLVLFLCLGYIINRFTAHRRATIIKGSILTGVIVLTALSFRTIDVWSSGLAINIDPFRPSLAKNTPICMPIPPTPSWYPPGSKSAVYGWYYESRDYGTCGKTHYDKTIDYSSFTHLIGKGRELIIPNPHDHFIKSILIPIKNFHPLRPTTVVLTNMTTNKKYTAPIASNPTRDGLTFVAFNLEDEPSQPEYRYILTERSIEKSNLAFSLFTDKSVAEYAYFLPPNKVLEDLEKARR